MARANVVIASRSYCIAVHSKYKLVTECLYRKRRESIYRFLAKTKAITDRITSLLVKSQLYIHGIPKWSGTHAACIHSASQRHMLRDRRPSTSICLPSLLVLGRLEKSRQDKNILYRHEKSNELTKEGPLSFVVPIGLCFNSQQGPPLSSLSGASHGLIISKG